MSATPASSASRTGGDGLAFEGRVAIVTGGARGIGAAMSTELAARGARVVVGELDEARARAFAADSGDLVAAHPCDVRSYEQVAALHDAALSAHGRLDYVIANAGVTDWGSMSEGDPERWRAVLETNVLGTAHIIRATLPTLLKQGHGHVVITASISGRVTYVGEPIYIASKWALVGLGRALRKEVAAAGIRVTLIEPGIVDTPLVSETEEGREELAQVRALDPGDVAAGVVFALGRPAHVDIDELVISPREQAA
jgi:NADP-dependent 3-hydroxy acid dehydrogenase YdfG